MRSEEEIRKTLNDKQYLVDENDWTYHLVDKEKYQIIYDVLR